MRIIDKNTDFYDYIQNIYKDDTFTFDRRDSFLLTKQIMRDNLHVGYWRGWRAEHHHKNHNYILLQICNSFWLFKANFIKLSDDYTKVEEYQFELIKQWKDYDKPRKLCALDRIEFYYFGLKYENITPDLLVQSIHINDYKHKQDLTTYETYNGSEKVTKHIPLLKACGIADCVNPQDIYLAFEEYFSLEKSDSERREPLGTTDLDKVESHGFDKKISFRGK